MNIAIALIGAGAGVICLALVMLVLQRLKWTSLFMAAWIALWKWGVGLLNADDNTPDVHRFGAVLVIFVFLGLTVWKYGVCNNAWSPQDWAVAAGGLLASVALFIGGVEAYKQRTAAKYGAPGQSAAGGANGAP